MGRRWVGMGCLLALILGTVGQVALAQAPLVDELLEEEETRIDVDFLNEDLREVIDDIERRVGVNIFVKGDIDERITVSLKDVHWLDALNLLAEEYGLKLEQVRENLYILSAPKRVNMEFQTAPVSIVLDTLARQAGKNIVLSDAVRGKTISLTLQGVDWYEALQTIAKTADLVVVEEGPNLIRVVPPDQLRTQLETRVFQLSYVRPPVVYEAVFQTREKGGSTSQAAKSAEIVQGSPKARTGDPNRLEDDFTLFKALKAVIEREDSGPGGAAAEETLEYNVETNSFIVTATPTKLREIENIIAKVDIEPEQVFIDVKFITTSNSNFWRIGLRTDETGSQGFRVGNSLGSFAYAIGEGVDTFEEAFNIPAVLDFSAMNLIAEFVERDNLSKVTQRPTLLTLNDQSATIFVGEDVPYAETSTQIDPNGNVVRTISEGSDSPVKVGFTLYVTPHIVPGTDPAEIILTVIPRVSSLSGTTAPIEGFEQFGVGGDSIILPRVQTRALITNLLVRDGNTAVIGGLMEETIIERETRIPILSAIPLLGNLFTFREQNFTQDNLIIFITPKVVRSRQQAAEIFEREYKIHQRLDAYYQKYLKESVEAAEDQETTTTDDSGQKAPDQPRVTVPSALVVPKEAQPEPQGGQEGGEPAGGVPEEFQTPEGVEETGDAGEGEGEPEPEGEPESEEGPSEAPEGETPEGEGEGG